MGAAPASFRLFWFEVLPTFAARYPGIEIATTAETVDEISAQLQSGDIDFAIGSLEALRANGRSEEHTSELQSLMRISSAVFCLKKKQNKTTTPTHTTREHTTK